MNKLDNMKEQMSNVSEKMRTKELKGNRRNQKDCNRNEDGHSLLPKSEIKERSLILMLWQKRIMNNTVSYSMFTNLISYYGMDQFLKSHKLPKLLQGK